MLNKLNLFPKTLILSITFILLTTINYSQQKAFPGAEGFGAYTTGGRGGIVVEVTNLKDSGMGSLRYAIETVPGARTIVFKVSGNIELESRLKITTGDLTIAGQTAPGDGICIQNFQVENQADNVIIRYIRFRLGDVSQQEFDAFFGRNQKNIIFDHCSFSWSIDECASFYDNTNFTMQYCIISESLNYSYHSKGEHGYGGIWGGHGASFHHNLIAHHKSRNPRFCGSRYTNRQDLELVDFANNVIYNWGENSIYAAEGGRYNLVNNYFKYGPATKTGVRDRIIEPWADGGTNYQPAGVIGQFHISGNYVYDFPEVTDDNWLGVDGSVADTVYETRSDTMFTVESISLQTAEAAFDSVLANAGANFPTRDSVDARIVYETETGTAQYGNNYEGGGKGIIDSQEDVGGYPELVSVDPPLDTDHDGMPDYWEDMNGLDYMNPEDRNVVGDDGYTMLETYLYQLVDGTITSIEESDFAEIPLSFKLIGNYPNPFNPTTIINYYIPKSGSVEVNVYDIKGSLVEKLVDTEVSSGYHNVVWNGRNAASGVYICAVRFGAQTLSHKMLLAK